MIFDRTDETSLDRRILAPVSATSRATPPLPPNFRTVLVTGQIFEYITSMTISFVCVCVWVFGFLCSVVFKTLLKLCQQHQSPNRYDCVHLCSLHLSPGNKFEAICFMHSIYLAEDFSSTLHRRPSSVSFYFSRIVFVFVAKISAPHRLWICDFGELCVVLKFQFCLLLASAESGRCHSNTNQYEFELRMQNGIFTRGTLFCTVRWILLSCMPRLWTGFGRRRPSIVPIFAAAINIPIRIVSAVTIRNTTTAEVTSCATVALI